MGWRLIVKDIQIVKFSIEAHRQRGQACNLGISICPNKPGIGSISLESPGLNHPGWGGTPWNEERAWRMKSVMIRPASGFLCKRFPAYCKMGMGDPTDR
jgi:hypothetical protein